MKNNAKYLFKASALSILILSSQAAVAAAQPRPAPVSSSTSTPTQISTTDKTAVSTQGGLSVTVPNTPYSFNINGVIRIDETLFLGNFNNRKTDYVSGAHLRTAELTFSGGLAPAVSYTLSVEAKPAGKLEVSDAFISYTGLSDNSNISLGQVPSTFSLEASSSGKWLSFLEKPLTLATFAPGYGLGLNARVWGDDLLLLATVIQPKYDAQVDPTNSAEKGLHSDRWGSSARLIYAPVKTADLVYQVGLSGTYQSVENRKQDGSDLQSLVFDTSPEAKARKTPKLVSTGPMNARSYNLIGAEAAGLWGPLNAKVEYMHAQVNSSPAHFHFSGWDITARYVLTGETREYYFKSGATFGRIRPQSKDGAWEVGARYSFVNLNNKTIRGGSEHNAGVSLGWYANDNVRVFGNYIRASIHPKNDAYKRKIGILAARLQVSW